MATPKDPIETLITFFTKKVAILQTGLYSIFWGVPVKASTTKQPSTSDKSPNFLQSGIFNILDTINGLDLCDVLSYITTTVNIAANATIVVSVFILSFFHLKNLRLIQII